MNIEEIMEKARARIEEKKRQGLFTEEDIRDIEEMELKILPDVSEIRSFYESHLFKEDYTEPGGVKGVLRKLFRGKLIKIFFFFMRPLLSPERIGAIMDNIKLLHNISHNLVVELSRQRVRNLELEARVKALEEKTKILENRIRAYEKE